MDRIRKVLYHEVSILVSIITVIVGFVYAVILPLSSVEHHIADIKDNHLMHIQEDMEYVKDELKQNQEEHKSILTNLTETTTTLKEHIRK